MRITNNGKLLSILIILVVFMGGMLWYRLPKHSNNIKTVSINGIEFKAEIARSEAEMSLGLGKRKNLCQECAMLFEFSKSGYSSFWMKDMKFPLDIIWIDGDRVVYVAENIAADYNGTIRPTIKASRVLEINAGFSRIYGIGEGTKIQF